MITYVSYVLMSKKYFYRESAGFERHVKSLHRVGQGTDADKVDTLFGIVADGIKGDAPTRLRLITVIDEIDSLLCVGHAEVIQHDTIYAAMLQDLIQFIE